jgi:hypothetical protein
MNSKALVIVVLPDEIKILDSDVAGRPVTIYWRASASVMKWKSRLLSTETLSLLSGLKNTKISLDAV